MRVIRSPLYFIAALVVGIGLQSASAQFTQTDLVSNVPGAKLTDLNLVDPWGIAFNGSSPAWIANEGTGVATLYTGGAQSPPVITQLPLIVSIPGPGPGGSGGMPTGTVFNVALATGMFSLGNGSAIFMFATRDGTIAGWNGGTSAQTAFTSTAGASYTGLAIATTVTGGMNPPTFLYAADFKNGGIDVINSSFSRTVLGSSSFTDPKSSARLRAVQYPNVGWQVVCDVREARWIKRSRSRIHRRLQS